MKLLLTRAEPDNQRLAQALAERGIDSCSVPLIETLELPEGPEQRRLFMDLDLYQAVMVVSPVAARIGLQRLDRYWPQPPVGVEWYAVGAGTGALLRQAGLSARWPCDGQDSEALLRMPEWQRLLELPDLRVLIWRADQGRELLVERVHAAGGRVDCLALYRRQPPAGLDVQLREAARAGVGGIVLLSVQALQNWHQAAAADWSQQRHWRCWVPGERVAQHAIGLGCSDVQLCHGADDAAVLAAVQSD